MSDSSVQLQPSRREHMNIVIAGHVDHGKSTVVGRLLADTDSLPKGKLDQIKAMCELNSKPFEYAFLLDALKDERSQGITIDSARVFFKSAKRDYIIIDAPGHVEFLKNMVSGASRAEAALLVIDAQEGVRENSRRHGYMLSMLGIRQIVVLVNKMDLVQFSQDAFTGIVDEFTTFLKEIDVQPDAFIPISGLGGENIATRSRKIDWYTGPSVLEKLDAFSVPAPDGHKAFRMPVQDVYKFTRMGDSRRIVAGTVETGTLRVGDEVAFYPSGKRSRVKSIEAFNRPARDEIRAGQATGFTLTEQIYVSRGELATRADEAAPDTARRLRVNLFWLGKRPLVKTKTYSLKLGTLKVGMKVEEVHRVLDCSDLNSSEKRDHVARHEVAECVLALDRAIAFDRTDQMAATGRFVIVDDYDIAGGGLIREGLSDKLTWVRDRVMIRNLRWEKSIIASEQRAEKYNQKATLVLLTGERKAGKKEVAKELEAQLFVDGKIVYFLGIGNVLYGIDADIKAQGDDNREEHLRRLAEVAHILLDAGFILLVTAVDLTQDDLEIIKATVDPDRILTVWVGDNVNTNITFDLKIPGMQDIPGSVGRLKRHLQTKGTIFNPW